MLTRENFKDTWARPKPDEKKKAGKTDGDEMSVDIPPKNKSWKKNEDTHDTEMGGVVESAVDERTTVIEKKAEEGRNGKSKSETWRKMPVFAFQRRGIGAVKPKVRNLRNSLPPRK